jgi:NAD(P)-dependent dehydrogenase (short-subunit alcohol dehydrogenase family)
MPRLAGKVAFITGAGTGIGRATAILFAREGARVAVTAERFREVEARLKSQGIDYIGPIAQLPGLLGIYFYDPNGIRLEFACQPEDGEEPAVIPCVTQTKAEACDELVTLPGVTPEWVEMRVAALPG